MVAFSAGKAIFALGALSGAVAANVIERDVVIIGGGASGAHAAVRLREDFGKSIVLVEKQDRLGGHVASYTDPESGKTIDYGVQSFINVGDAKAFFARLNVSIGSAPRVSNTPLYADFATGQNLSFTGPSSADRTAALEKYIGLCEQYEHMLLPGYWDFPAGNAIPEELLIPFGDFAQRHGLEAMLPQLFSTTGLGVGDVTKELTIWVMQAFGAPMARALTGKGETFVPASLRNQDLYDSIAELLGSDVLYSTTATKVSRNNKDHVEVTVQNNVGEVTLIRAKRILVSIQPVGGGLGPFDLDENEKAVFDQLDYTRIYAGLVTNSALPENRSVTNLPATAEPSNYYAYPDLTFTARFDSQHVNRLFRVMVLGDKDTLACKAKQNAQAALDTLVELGVISYPADFSGERALKFKAFADHGPMHPRVSAGQLKAGFLRDMYALQGVRNTWWTGGAWSVQFQTILWEFNEILLPKLVEGL